MPDSSGTTEGLRPTAARWIPSSNRGCEWLVPGAGDDGVATAGSAFIRLCYAFAREMQYRPWQRQEVGTEMKTIGTEEHFVTEEVVTAWSRLDSRARDDSRASAPP